MQRVRETKGGREDRDDAKREEAGGGRKEGTKAKGREKERKRRETRPFLV